MSKVNLESYHWETVNDVDFFYTYYNGVHYLIPFSKSGKSETSLRFKSKTPNNPTIRWAKDFEANKILEEITKEEVV